MSHAAPGDLCTDDCRHICGACELGYGEVCEDLFELPTGGVVACQSSEAAVTPPECRVFGCNMPALADGKCVRCGDGPGRGPDMCPADCGRRKRRNHLMCGSCWGSVSPTAQREVLRAFATWRRATGDFELLSAYKTAALAAVRQVS